MKKLICSLLALAAAGVLAYLAVLGMLVWKEDAAMKQDWKAEDYEAIVVLGAQVKADGSLSVQLQWRLDAAYEAWQNRAVPVVVCGAQGSNEPEPEAHAMKRYLMGLGIPEDQILMDDTSFNTRDNIRHAAELLAGREVREILVVTSDYHLPRALALSGDEGLNAVGLGSKTLPAYWLKNHGRETLAWVKYWMQKILHR